MLGHRVAKIDGAANGMWQGIPTTCHFATCFWMFTDYMNRPPANQKEYLDCFGNPELVVRAVIQQGSPRLLTRPSSAGPPVLTVAPGSVVVFIQDGKNGRLGHSCVAMNENRVGGYNQTGWFFTGVSHEYTSHHTSELRWRGDEYPQDVEGNVLGKSWYQLMAIEGETAKKIAQQYKP
jgi:hypothetical protein